MKGWGLLLLPGRDAVLYDVQRNKMEKFKEIVTSETSGLMTVAPDKMDSAVWDVGALQCRRYIVHGRTCFVAWPKGIDAPTRQYVGELVEDLSTRRAVN